MYLITNSLGYLLTYRVLNNPRDNNELVVAQPYYTHSEPRNNLIVARKGLHDPKTKIVTPLRILFYIKFHISDKISTYFARVTENS